MVNGITVPSTENRAIGIGISVVRGNQLNHTINVRINGKYQYSISTF
jgi:hypothetical protein